MDAFEQVILGLFFSQGYWVTQGYKVELTPDEKRAIGRHSSPRWEIDLIAYQGKTNRLLAIECKSYLDSPGVLAGDILSPKEGEPSRYKLFVEPKLREIVLNRLSLQLNEIGLIPKDVKAELGLVAGKLRYPQKDALLLKNHFAKEGWHFFGPDWIVERLRATADESYFDSVAHVVSKMILRNPSSSSSPNV